MTEIELTEEVVIIIEPLVEPIQEPIVEQVFELTVDDQLMLVNIVNFLHQKKNFVYIKGAFFTVIKALKWFAVNLSSNIASNKI